MDITHGEHVEKELNLLISRRDEKRRAEEGERQAEEMWAESEQRYTEQRREAMRLEWRDYHRAAAERARRTLETLVAEHEAAARVLESGEGEGGS